jgi:hypothetical protein
MSHQRIYFARPVYAKEAGIKWVTHYELTDPATGRTYNLPKWGLQPKAKALAGGLRVRVEILEKP